MITIPEMQLETPPELEQAIELRLQQRVALLTRAAEFTAVIRATADHARRTELKRQGLDVGIQIQAVDRDIERLRVARLQARENERIAARGGVPLAEIWAEGFDSRRADRRGRRVRG